MNFLWEVTSHIVGYPTIPLLQTTGNYLTALPPTLKTGELEPLKCTYHVVTHTKWIITTKYVIKIWVNFERISTYK